MQRDEKLAVLDAIFGSIPQTGVTAWGSTGPGRWYMCDSHGTADRLATVLLSRLHMQGIYPTACPHRFDPPQTGPKLIIEPMNDARPIA